MEELKPCPGECKCKPLYCDHQSSGGGRFVMCPGCEWTGPVCGSKGEAFKMWNTRSSDVQGVVDKDTYDQLHIDYCNRGKELELLQSDVQRLRDALEKIQDVAGTIEGKGTKQAVEIWRIIRKALTPLCQTCGGTDIILNKEEAGLLMTWLSDWKWRNNLTPPQKPSGDDIEKGKKFDAVWTKLEPCPKCGKDGEVDE